MSLIKQPVRSPTAPLTRLRDSSFQITKCRSSQAGADLLPLIPVANAGVPGAALYNASPTQPTNWREELLRIDQNFGTKWAAMFRYTHDSWNTITPTTVFTGSAFPTVQTNFIGPAVSIVARLNWNPSPSLVNEFVFSYTTDHITFTSTGTPNPNAWQRPPNMPMGAIFNNGFGGKLPAITLTGNAAYGGDILRGSQWRVA